jgi:hypothetical protein
MVLLLSFATDKMIKEVQKNPEVWFMDVTSAANIQKRTSSSWLSGNLMAHVSTCNLYTVLCCLLTIVYHNRSVVGIPVNYTNIFPKHFGDITVQRNRLGLIDADPCEYITFERTIVLDRNFKLSKRVFCIFHAIWQPFKDNIRQKLPMSGNNKNIL